MKNAISGEEFAKLLTERIPADILYKALTLSKISSQISFIRIEKGMSQKQFADFMGVSQSMVSKWENGDYNFSLCTLIDVFNKLNYKVDISITQKPSEQKTNKKVSSGKLVFFPYPNSSYNEERKRM